MTISSKKYAKIDSKRSFTAVAAHYDPVELPADFPCRVSPVFQLGQEPFTYVHRHNYLELNLCYAGSGICIAGRKLLPFGAGDVIILSNAELHMARSPRGTEGALAWMLLDPVRLLGPAGGAPQLLSSAGLAGPEFINVLHPDEHPQITGLVRLLFEEMRRQAPGYRDVVRGLVWALMGLFHRLPGVRPDAAPELPSVLDDLALKRLRPALQLMLNQFQEPLAINHLAARCHLSPVTFRRHFHALTGESPLHYLTRLRLQMACALLDGSRQPVSDIARAVGYPSPSNFNRHFRLHTGLSPRAWRQRQPPLSADAGKTGA